MLQNIFKLLLGLAFKDSVSMQYFFNTVCVAPCLRLLLNA